MYPPMIDHDEAIAKFQQLLEPRTPYRFLRLFGEKDMGKTMLMTKVFPALARYKDAAPVLIDMRSSQRPVDVMRAICHQLDLTYFRNFDRSYIELLNIPDIQITRFTAIFASVKINNQPNDEDTIRYAQTLLTHNFIDDLRKWPGRTIVLLFDETDRACTTAQSWLLDTLLGYLLLSQQYTHVRVVVAGRQLPPHTGSYDSICNNHTLRPVIEIEPYIRYCRAIGSTLTEDQILLLIKNSGYVLGVFANTAKLLAPQGLSHD